MNRYLTQQDGIDLPNEGGPDGLVGERFSEAIGKDDLHGGRFGVATILAHFGLEKKVKMN